MPKGRILAIDDELLFRTLYDDLLTEQGYFVRAVPNGETGIRALEQEPYDLVITDLMMPGIDGIETARRMRRLNPSQTIVMVTSTQDVRTAVAALKLGISDYLLKPFKPEEFLPVVDRCVQRARLASDYSKLLEENMEMLQVLTVYQRCMKMLAAMDLVELRRLILESLMAETGARGGLLWVGGARADRMELVGHQGQVDLGTERTAFLIGEHPSHEALLQGKTVPDRDAQGRELPDALLAPLRVREKVVGLAKVLGRDGQPFGTRERSVARTLAEFAGVALRNALELDRRSRRSFKDPETETYQLTYFADLILRESARAKRYRRTFSLLNLRLDNWSILQKEFPAAVLQQALARIVENARDVLRESDVMAQVSDQEYSSLLPETDYFGSVILMRRIQRSLQARRFVSDEKKSFPILYSLGAASFPRDGDTLEDLLQAVDRRMQDRRTSLIQKLGLEDRPFWEVVLALIGPADAYDGLQDGHVSEDLRRLEDPLGRSLHTVVAAILWDQIPRAFASEVVANPERRGILYLGLPRIDKDLPLVADLSHQTVATRTFLMGERQERGWDAPGVTPIEVKEPELRRHVFLLYLSEDSAYALLGRRRGDGSLCAFHTSDPVLVEGLIARLEEHYAIEVRF